ncbi:MAG TPA: hypothetical protein VFL14_01900 [Xanthomonadales bacterium]|nr:hypothetical protein [Xanthomonadales bacterium]
MPFHPRNSTPDATVELTLTPHCLGAECVPGRPSPAAAGAIVREVVQRFTPEAEVIHLRVENDEVFLYGRFADAASLADSMRRSSSFELDRFPDRAFVEGRIGLQSVEIRAHSGRVNFRRCENLMGMRRVSRRSNEEFAAILESAAAHAGCTMRSPPQAPGPGCNGDPTTGAVAYMRCGDPAHALAVVDWIEREAPDAPIQQFSIRQEPVGAPQGDWLPAAFGVTVGLSGSIAR